MIQFYAPEIENLGILPEGESSHCVRVLRKKKGDEIVVTDGRGRRYLCEIVNPDPKGTEVKIIEKEIVKDEKGYYLTLAVAPTKNAERMEWMAEKAVEIGVDKIILLRCNRSERKFLKKERLEKVMISAMKQSLSTFLPELEETKDYISYVTDPNITGQKFFGYCDEKSMRKEFVKECKKRGEVTVMIGPEGDFTPEEVELALNNGFIAVSFGNKRLRTETAGVFCLSAVSVINQL